MSPKLKTATLLLFFCVAAASHANAQGNVLGSISGSVADQDNQPVQGLHITVMAGFPRSVASVPTDGQGVFRVTGLQPGNYYVLVVARGQPLSPALPGVSQFDYRGIYYVHATSLQDAQIVSVKAGEETSDIRFTVDSSRTYDIAGKVAEVGNLGGVSLYDSSLFLLEVRRAGWNRPDELVLGGAPSLYVPARPDGGFELRSFPPGEFTIAVRRRLGTPTGALGPYVGYTSVHVLDRDTQIDIPVDGTGEVRGKIVWEGAKPNASTEIPVTLQVILQSEGQYDKRSVGSVDEGGAFVITNVEAGFPYTLRVALPREYSSYSQRVQCGGQDYTKQPITVGPGATLTDCIVTLGNVP